MFVPVALVYSSRLYLQKAPTNSWEISSGTMLLGVFEATWTITSIVEPLFVLVIFSLDYLVKFKVLIPFCEASSGVVLIHSKICLVA